MSADSGTNHLLLSVWRPARHQRLLYCPPLEYGGQDRNLELSDSNFLQEEIYCWTTTEDIWSGLPDTATKNRLSELLTNTFDQHLSPDKRNLNQLASVLTQFRESLKMSEWSDAQQTAGDQNLRYNSILALFEHLQWVYTVFKHVPAVSLVVR